MYDFENKVVRNMFTSQYVASWCVAGGSLSNYKNRELFKDWLRSLVIDGEHLTDDEVRAIFSFATAGKFELQEYAKVFLKTPEKFIVKHEEP